MIHRQLNKPGIDHDSPNFSFPFCLFWLHFELLHSRAHLPLPATSFDISSFCIPGPISPSQLRVCAMETYNPLLNLRTIFFFILKPYSCLTNEPPFLYHDSIFVSLFVYIAKVRSLLGCIFFLIFVSTFFFDC